MTEIRVERRGAAAIVTIDREPRRNALSRATLAELGALKEPLLGDDSLRAIIITGAGQRAFCAGADLKERLGMSEAQVRDQLRAYKTELSWLDESRVPVIAAINGAALGGGLELALLCDLRIAAPHATFAFPETGLGIIPAAGGTWRATRLLGAAAAKELILLGTRLDAAEALSAGLIHRVSASAERLLEDALSWLEPILKGAPLAQAAALAAIDAAEDLELAAGLEKEHALYERCLTSDDRTEALLAFSEKRPPIFQGR
ncbi:MAG: hypothetical protein RJA70_1256 [Pseudomonadota bacterium]|jgi:enoyl-CoA hydratase/carnithine racemase